MKYHFYKKLILSLCCFLLAVNCFSQQTIADTADLASYNHGLHLYNTKGYAAAQETFIKVNAVASKGTSLEAESSYLIAMCAIKLNQTDADKRVLSFIEDHPNSSKKNTALFNVANYYFANKRPAYALKWFQKVAIDELSIENKEELNFKMGYSFLATKNLALAKTRFLPLINDAKYGNDARYYYGFIAYKLEDYGIAESTLKEIADNESYRAEISYYLLDISFKGGKFKRCIDVGLKLLPTVARKLKSDVSKIIGESYFNLQEYAAAIPYLKEYRGAKGKWNNTDYYQLGYAYYKQNDFENAINNFNKIVNQKNTVAQNAYYHLGECYLNIAKKAAALNAFKSASEMSFDTKIQEDAALNYAKLSYEEGNPFESVSEVLQNYLKKYPKSKAYKEINALVISSFLSQQNYKGALTFLAAKKTDENIKLKKEVSLYRGMQLFNEEKYTAALPFFKEGKKSEIIEIHQKSSYWQAETMFRLVNYKDALVAFTSLENSLNRQELNSFPLLKYNIGYTYFNLKKYDEAISAFTSFLNGKEILEELKYDALIRLGDSYFATTKYRSAISAYKKVTENTGLGADYAAYQIGMSYGFLNENEAKITALKEVINNYQVSNLKDDALYELGNTYSKLKDNTNAHIAYNRLLEKHPKSIFLSRALLRQGLLYFNDNANMASLMKYKDVAERFPNSPDALEAVANARNVYIEEGNLDDYVNWIATLEFVNITNAELDNTTFAIAERKYLNSKIGEEIIASLQNYINKFPIGIHKIKANYYLADVLFRVKEFKRAIAYYTFIIEEEQSQFTEDALNKLAQIYLNKNNFSSALPILDRLEQEAYISENILFAQSNLMKGYYETAAYDLAINYAQKILQKDKIDKVVANDARKIIARSSIKNENLILAEEYYTQIEETANGELKAEALYYNAYFKNQQKKYEASNVIVQKLIAKYASYKYWAVKSYVVMGKNYYGLEDIYQATFVLENVIKNFKEFEDIIKDAQLELDTIKKAEAKINNAISPENKN